MRTLYRASLVRTLGHPPAGDWILIDDRHVQRVGSGGSPQADRTVELPGAVIVPGFIDAHVHLTSTGMGITSQDVYASRDAGDLLRAVAARSSGKLIYLNGWDESKWSDQKLPTLDELDRAAGVPIVLARVDGHVSLANSAALGESGALAEDGVEKDAEGNPTGLVVRAANERLDRWATGHLDDRAVQDLQLQAAALAASRGVTSVHEMSMPQERGLRDLQVLLDHLARLPVDVTPILGTTDVPQAIDLGLPAIGGDLPVDGSIGARTAALSERYEDRDHAGAVNLTDEALEAFFGSGHAAGLQVGVHAIGDLAIERVVSAWERVYAALDSRDRRHFRARRHRIEHFELASPEVIERAAMLGLAASVQPAFDPAWGQPGGLYERALGWERAGAMNPFRTLLERALEVGAGSDSPITPLDPMLGIWSLEHHHDPGQRISRAEAVRLWTVGSARLAHQDKKGVLEPGMHADLAAYDRDPIAIEDVRGLRPILCVSLGREVYAA